MVVSPRSTTLPAITLSVVLLWVISVSAFGEEPRLYTEQDLERYTGGVPFDQATAERRESDLRQWEEAKRAEEERLRKQLEAEEKQEAKQKLKEARLRRDQKKADDSEESATLKRKKRKT
jgi:hypothetical protein